MHAARADVARGPMHSRGLEALKWGGHGRGWRFFPKRSASLVVGILGKGFFHVAFPVVASHDSHMEPYTQMQLGRSTCAGTYYMCWVPRSRLGWQGVYMYSLRREWLVLGRLAFRVLRKSGSPISNGQGRGEAKRERRFSY